jgi:hypothetical protein
MKWIKYFESFNNDELLDNIMDILSEISDTGRYRVEEYNNNPSDAVVKNNLDRITFYIDKNYIRTGNPINKEDIEFISPVLDRLQRYLQTYNIDLYFEIRISKKNTTNSQVSAKIFTSSFKIKDEEVFIKIRGGRNGGYRFIDLEKFENLDYYSTWISIEFKNK